MITHLLAIDAGGTKTALCLSACTGDIIEKLTSYNLPAASLTLQGAQAIVTIQNAVEECLANVQINKEQVSIVIGVAGAGEPDMRKTLVHAFSGYPYCEITTDAHISVLGANLGEPVNMIAVGTGVVASKLSSINSMTTYGGWGFPIGDQGGGAWIGQQAVRALILSIEQQKFSTLTHKIKETLGSTRQELLSWLKQATATDYAKFAVDVVTLANSGCLDSKAIMNEGSQHIQSLVAQCCYDNELNIIFLGSLGHHYENMLLESDYPLKSRIIKPKGNAVDGGILLAHKNSLAHQKMETPT